MNSLKFPLSRMPNVDRKMLFGEMKKRNLLETVYYYVVDSKFRQSVQIRSWVIDAVNTINVNGVCPQFVGAPVDDATALAVLRWVKMNVTYTGDKGVWGYEEKWQTPTETWNIKSGDCEDGAVLLYAVLHQLGFSDDQVYIKAGKVVGGGHCYVTYVSSEDAVEYVLDWCYWFDRSKRLNNPYGLEPNYFFGREEWFAVNCSGSFVSKR